ncbi:hypothetical protein CK203_008073 [Vitis vinifera]|uniref:Retrotransposon Copia-like N-terminal domain-containing protein n=1 Tax=Vitis vinifera TaxID=29760 RepID=A0A438K1Y8_VITVI|nr:hypothetical protein CK203_008073 [Vitis vinifera]
MSEVSESTNQQVSNPTSTNDVINTPDTENSMVMMWLVNSMDEDISSNYMCYPTAKELWDNINQMYSDLGNQSQIFELKLKLGEIQQDATANKANNYKHRMDEKPRVWCDH